MGRQKQRQRERLRRQREQARLDNPDTETPARPSGRGPRKPTPKAKRGGINRWGVAAGIVIIAIVIAIFAYEYSQQSVASPSTPTTTPVATGTPSTASVAPKVDGVGCQTMGNVIYHIHQHLDLYLNGKHVNVPSLIGIPVVVQNKQLAAKCFYWIHVHQETPNIIHVESPIRKTFHLGAFFDIWVATKDTIYPKGDSYVTALRKAAANGNVTAYVNGKPWTKGYANIPLKSHSVITIEIGKPIVPPKPFTNWNGL
ncbi:MAG: hypothetical protein ACRDFX_02925 [Chloroflexota bacterium]